MRRVSLVFSFQFPGKYALTVLAGAVEAADFGERVRLFFPRDRESILACAEERLAEGDRVILAWSFYSPSFPTAAEELAWVRARLGNAALCIAGGVHATAETEQTLAAGFDLVAVGEGEVSLLALIERALAGEDERLTRGFSRLEGGRVVPNGRGELIELDRYPPFAPAHRRFGAIEITRGCRYACRFCATPFINRARFRHRSVENVRRWAGALRRAGKRDLRFISPTSLSYGSPDESVNLAAVEALLAACREAMGPDGRVFFGTFPSEVRPEHVSPESLALLKRYVDNDNLIIGGQSGSDRVLESSHRGHRVEDIVRAARVCVEGGFVPNIDFILGLPGEDESDVWATVSLMETLGQLGARVHGHTFMPLPGTPFRDAPPGKVGAAIRQALDRLASQGMLYGQWKAQEAIAAGIAERRPNRRRVTA